MLIDFRQQPTKCDLYGPALPLIQSQEQRESVEKDIQILCFDELSR